MYTIKNKKIKSIGFYALITFTIFISCKKTDTNLPSIEPEIDIYIAGNKENLSTPFIIKNGEFSWIEIEGISSDKIGMNDFKISNGKQYYLFQFTEPAANQSEGAYMIDQQVYYVPKEYSKYMRKMFIQNNDLYIAGNLNNDPPGKSYVLKNGKLFKKFETEGWIIDFDMSGNNSYFLPINDFSYFKNDQKIEIEKLGEYNYFHDIFIKGNSVYLSGSYVKFENAVPLVKGIYWIDGEIFNLPPTDLVQHTVKIERDQNNLYLLFNELEYGTTSSKYIKYLKNGEVYNIPHGSIAAVPMDMKIYNGDIYTLLTIQENGGLFAKVFRNTKEIAKYDISDVSYYEKLYLGIEKRK